MTLGWIPRLLILSLLLVPAACASSRRSTREIYAELVWGGGMICTPVAVARVEQRQDERFNARMRALNPWLEAQLGAAEMAEIRRATDEEMSTVYFVGCPSEEAHSHLRTRRRTLLGELEYRSRQRPRD